MAYKDMMLENEVEIDSRKTSKPSFDYFNATNFSKMQNKTETTEKELNRFKTDYDARKLNRVYEKYDLFQEDVTKTLKEDFYEEEPEDVTFQKSPDFNKVLKEQNQFEELEDTLTYKKIERNPRVKFQLNSKTKLMLFTYTFVSVMLVFLFIYNVFALSNLNSSINTLQNNITTEQANIERIIKDIGNMTSEDNILDVANDLSFAEIPVQNIITVELYEKQTVVRYEGQTNWFDAFTKFLSNLFGG